MKKLLFCLLVFIGFVARGQVYNNEWIDYSKTYYKFKVGKNGLFRIPQATLATAGLGSTPAEQFQLWRNGVQVPIYTSVATGALTGSDYIEFWGEMNDGKADKQLYRKPEYQLNDKWSLQTDSATYFLTINASGNNQRLVTTANNVAGNTLPVEPYFTYTAGQYFKDRMNYGFAVNVGDYMYSSSYDKGEGWSSNDIGVNGTNSFTFSNLYPYSGGPAAKFSIALSGNAINQRRYLAKINNDSIIGNSVDFFNYKRDTATFTASKLTNNATVTVTNITDASSDRMVVHQYELTYPRQFNFGGAANFEFTLPASAAGNYLEIAGFAFGGTAPVLYDLTNGKRYVGEVAASLVKIVLAASAQDRRLVLVSEDAGNINNISGLQSRNFVDYRQAQNQADYLIISNPLLSSGPNGTNPIEEYRQYRSSTNGGAYNAKTFMVDDLIDQFAFGIKKHPLGLRNFILFARNNFTVVPKHVLLLGKGVNYVQQRGSENHPDIHKLNLVPTFGWPASDILLAADPGDSYPKISIGRLSVINGQEVMVYLDKVKEHESAQRAMSPYIKDKAWMKNVVHVVGSSEPGLQLLLDHYMTSYKGTISDTLFGAKVTTFTKTSPEVVQQIGGNALEELFEEGISLITYFGHSSANTLEFNLNNPDQYNNKGKYPLFIALGCNVGNFYNFNTIRFTGNETLSERYTLEPERGTIGFIASTHFGIVHYLDIYNSRNYKAIASKNYGSSIGEIMQSAIAQTFAYTTQEDFYARATSEETALHGDPAITINPHAKPDYVIEDNLLRVTPSFVSVADQFIKIKAKFLNIGKAINGSISIEVKREYPNQTSEVVFRDTIPAIRYSDSVEFNIPIDPIRDKGSNKLTVFIDAGNNVEELFETNNSITKEFVVFEDEARTVYPYNFAIINRQNIKFVASAADPFSVTKQYMMEVDTTELFNSPAKLSQSISAGGGIMEFDPGIVFRDNTTYYWRVAQVPTSGPYKWNMSSFIYLSNSQAGYNQSHLYQHTKSGMQRMYIDSLDRSWKYSNQLHNLFIRNGVFPTSASFAVDFSIAVDGDAYVRSVCGISNVIVNVFDPVTFKPWLNAYGGQPGQYGSDPVCGNDRKYNFQFNIIDTSKRRKLLEFLEFIPPGSYVVVRNTSGTDFNSNTYSNTWKGDTSYLGSNRSIYHHLLNQGFSTIDSFNKPRAFIFAYKKDEKAVVTPKHTFSEGIYDKITLSADYHTLDTLGYITSPIFGPAKQWKSITWEGNSSESPSTDTHSIEVIGLQANGNEAIIYNNLSEAQRTMDISSINAQQYPFIKLKLRNADPVNHTPYQLKYWRLTYEPSPEGAVAPNLLFTMKDTIEVGAPLEFRLAFKNISEANFDSLKVKMTITDKDNVVHELSVKRQRPLSATDTLHITYDIDTRLIGGANTLYVEVNPDNDQPEQYHFNNFLYKSFYVAFDNTNPLMDVTFDNMHILNGDIVSAKPFIQVKLKDEIKSMLLDDTALVNIKIKDPDGIERAYHFNNDTLQFIPAQRGPGNENTATINFKPYFIKDGNYQLILSGKDKSDNKAGELEYRVDFQVINKPMISNVLNYPNPFTSSTAFVFTITGVEVPQNLKIQILTVTGKIVKEITKGELGPLHIGRNITDYKWDGTDQYGQQLANGVYLYRVITNLNGSALEKYKTENDNTDKFFNKGYGKMYLMR